jgi:hypothetical protein
VNEGKSRIVDLGRGESFGFLGFDFRRVRSRRGRWRPQYMPQLAKRTAVLQKLKAVFRRYVSCSMARVIAEINPVLRGSTNYFRIGHAIWCFGFVRTWVEKRVRRHMMGRGIDGASAGRGGVRPGSTPCSGCMRTTECGMWPGRTALPADRSHNP